MRHRSVLLVALAMAFSVAAVSAPAIAASPSTTTQTSFPGPGAGAKEKKLAYGRYCGAEIKRRNARKAKERRACIDAMARLGAGKASSPSAACRGLKPKRSKARKRSGAAYKRCVKSGNRLKKDQKAADEAALDEETSELDGDSGDPDEQEEPVVEELPGEETVGGPAE